MRKQVYFCDRCGCEIVDAGVKIVPHYFDFETEDLISPLNQTAEDKHFCIDCTMLVMEAMEPPKEEPNEKKEQNIKKNKPLDAGKVMALHQAGWDNDKIADEMGVTARQIYQCIYYQVNKKSLDNIQEKEAQP